MKTTPHVLDVLTDAVIEGLGPARMVAAEGVLDMYGVRSELGRCLSALNVQTLTFDDAPACPFVSGTRRPDPTAIELAIKARGLNQTSLAGLLGISRAAVSKAIAREQWSRDRFLRFATVLGVTVDELVLKE